MQLAYLNNINKSMSKNELSRKLAIRALQANPSVIFLKKHLAGLSDPSFEVSFEELAMDSLARMELSIWLEIECGIKVTEVAIMEMKSLAGLTEFIRTHMEQQQ